MGPTSAYLTHTIIECIAYAVAWYVYRRQSSTFLIVTGASSEQSVTHEHYRNEFENGDYVKFRLSRPCVRGITLRYDNLFRVIIMQFLDPAIFDVRSVKRSCVHIVHPDGRIIPFDTMNIFYRDGLQERTDQLRSEIRPT